MNFIAPEIENLDLEKFMREALMEADGACPMCLDAVVMSDAPHIIYAVNDRIVHSKISIETSP